MGVDHLIDSAYGWDVVRRWDEELTLFEKVRGFEGRLHCMVE